MKAAATLREGDLCELARQSERHQLKAVTFLLLALQPDSSARASRSSDFRRVSRIGSAWSCLSIEAF